MPSRNMDPEERVRLMGVLNEPVLRNARRIASYAIPVILCVPIIPGFTDSQSNIESIAKFATGLRTVTQIELLPYHQLGERKYEWLGRDIHRGALSHLDKNTWKVQEKSLCNMA